MALEAADLSTAPLPRMAGHLSFMRARRVTLDELRADSLAIIGAPMETSQHRSSGFRFAPRALRETSVYFGWHANAQFSHPVDIDERRQIDTSSIHDRLVDLGDMPLDDLAPDPAAAAVGKVLHAVSERGASSIVLGGDCAALAPTLAAQLAQVNRLGLLQFGGRAPDAALDRCAETLLIAPLNPVPVETRHRVVGAGQATQMSDAHWNGLSAAIDSNCDALLVHLDLSALQSALHGMADAPRIGGMSLVVLQRALIAIGQANVRCLLLTGLNPTIDGLSVVKTGQRLLVTALLGFIYARLGLWQPGPASST